MALNSITNIVKTTFVGDTKGVEQGAQRGKSALGGLADSAKLAKIAITGLAVGAIGRFLKSSVQMAAHVEESENLFRVSFKGMADEAEAWSKSVATATGLSEFTLRENSATIFQMTSSMGIATDEAFGMATGITKLANDMASFFNLRPEDAFLKLQAGITGEAEPLKRLGILVSENFVKETAYARAIEATGRKMTEQEKVTARYHAILAQTGDAQGDLEATMDSFTNVQRSNTAQMEILKIKMGQELIPIMNDWESVQRDGMEIGIRLVQVFKSMTPEARKLTIQIAGLAAAFKALRLAGFLQSGGLAAKAMTAIGTAAGISVGAIAAIGVAIAGLTVIAKGHNEELKETLTNAQKLELIARALQAGGRAGETPQVGVARDLGIELGILDEEGRRTADSMAKLQEEFDRLGVKGATTEERIQSLGMGMNSWTNQLTLTATAVPEFASNIEKSGDALKEQADAIVASVLATGQVPPAVEKIGAATEKVTKETLAAEKAWQSYLDSFGTKDLVAELDKMQEALATGLKPNLDMLEQIESKLKEATSNGITGYDLLTEAVETNTAAIKARKDALVESLRIETGATTPQEALRAQEIKQQAESLQLIGRRATASKMMGDLRKKLGKQASEIGLKRIEDMNAEAAAKKALDDEDIKRGEEQAAASAKKFADMQNSVQELSNLFQILGIDATSSLGSMLSSVSLLTSAMGVLSDEAQKGFKSMSPLEKAQAGIQAGIQGVGAVMQATATGSTTARTAKGAMAGASAGTSIGGMFGPIGAGVGAAIGGAAGALTGLFRGKDAEKAMATFKRDLGDSVAEGMSEGLITAIKDSGKNAQLMIADIFAEGIANGTATVDDLAREMVDALSGITQGLFSEEEGIGAIEAALPLLLQNLEDLGPAGEEQIGVLIAAAQDMGLEIEGLAELISVRLTDEVLEEMGLAGVTNVQKIRDAAEELGIGFDVLRDKILGTFAPQSLEQMMETLNLTNAEARGLAETLGIDVATNLELAALSAGLTVEEFKKLQEAAGTALGLDSAASLEELQALMDATGLSAETLAERLGVEVAGGADQVDEGIANANTELELAIELSRQFKQELLEAANAANGININTSGIPGAANEAFIPKRPGGTLVNVGEGNENEFVLKESTVNALRGGGGGSTTNNIRINIDGGVLSTPEELSRKLEPGIVRALADSAVVRTSVRNLASE